MKLSAGWRGDRGQGLWGSNLRGAGRGAPTPAGTRGAGHQRFFTRAAVDLQCGLSPGPHESLLGQLAPAPLWIRPHRVSLCPVAPPRGGWGTPASLPWLSATQEHPIKLSCFSWVLVIREGSCGSPRRSPRSALLSACFGEAAGGSGSREVVRLTKTDVPEWSCWLRG